MREPGNKLRQIVGGYLGVALDPGDPLWEQLEEVHAKGGEWLFRQGEAGDSLYFLVRGRLQVWIEGGEEPGESESRMLGEIAPGESVGEIGLLTGEPRTAGIRAIRDSTLVKLDRAHFERLSRRHPELALKLAGSIATRLHHRTSLAPPSARALGSVAIIPLDETPRIGEFCDRLAEELGRRGRCLCFSAQQLGEAGAPLARLESEQEVPEALKHWLADQEDNSRFLLYRGDAAASLWSSFAARQSDLVLLVAEAGLDPEPRSWEGELAAAGDFPAARRLLVLLQPPSSQPISGTARWLAGRSVEAHLHVRADQPEDLRRVARVIAGEAVGLVLGAGAVRGLSQLGIYRAMVELGVPVDWVGGTSIGAILAAAIALGRGPEHVIEVARESFVRGKPMSDYTVPNISLLRGARLKRLLKQHLQGDIEDLPLPFFCISSVLDTGDEHIHERGAVWKAVRASASLPGLYAPAVVNRRLVIDGAVLNNLPVDHMKRKLVGRVVAVDVSSRKSREVDFEEVPSPWAVLRGRLLPFARRYRLPGLMSQILKAMEIGALAKARALGREADLLLTPPVDRFGMTQVKAFDRLVEVGYEYAREPLAEWLRAQAAEAGR